MLKRKRTIALLSSAIILANSTSGAINEFKVFAEDNIMPIVKENLLDSKNNQSNITQPDSSGDVQLPENSDSSDVQLPENSDSSNDSGITVQPGNPGSSNDSSATPLPLAPEFKLTGHSAIENNGIYYTNNGEIEFNFNVQNVDNITVEGSNDAFIWANSGVTPEDDKVTIKLNILQPDKVINTKIKFTSVNGDSKYCDLSFINDTIAPTISFKKDENGSDFEKDNFDNNGVYYLTSNQQDNFNLYIKIDDNANIPEVEASTTNGKPDFILNSPILENGYYKFNISDIEENKENTLSIKVTDITGNESYEEFKFFKDTAKAEVSIKSGKLKLHNDINYIQNDDCNDLVLDLEFKNIENISDFDKDDFIKNNILVVDDENIPLYDNKSSIILSKIENNKATLTLKDVPTNKMFNLKFTGLKDNDKDTVESTFKLYKDTVKPDISLGDTDKEVITYTESNKLYLKYNETSAKLTLNNNNLDEDLLFSAVIKDKSGKETALSTIDDKNVFEVTVPVNSTNTVILTATDYSGNETTLNYEIIQDNNDYSTFNFPIITTTFAGNSFENNELYIYDKENNTFSFEFEFDKKVSKDNFVIYNNEKSEENIIDDLTNNGASLTNDVNLNHIAQGNDFTYILSAKNGSLDEENTYKIYYTNKYDLSISFLDNNTFINNDGIYSDASKNFNFNATIADATIVNPGDGVSNVTGVKVDLLYTPFEGKPIKVENILLNPDSKYLKVGYKNILVDKKEVKAKTYTLSKDFILDKLDFKNGKFEDGTYSIEINVESKFDYPEEATKKAINFVVYSSAPEATLVLRDVNNNKLVTVNKDRAYINTDDVYIGIQKEKFSIADHNEKYKKNYTRIIKINNQDYDFKNLQEYGEFEDYILYKPIDKNDTNLLKLISDDKKDYKDYKFDVCLSDKLEKDYVNSKSSTNIYTIDRNAPMFDIYSESIYGDIIKLINDAARSNAPFINLKNIISKITNENNDTIEKTTVSRDRFLWFDQKYHSNTTSDINITDVLNINEEGFYKFKIVSIDKAGNKSTREFSLNVDTQNPEIDMRDIAEDKAFANLNTLSVDINRKPFFTRSLKNMFVSDTMNSTINLDLNLSEAVTKKSYSFNTTSNSPEFNISSVEDGTYKVVLTATDEAGNKNSSEGKITIDGSKPVVSTRLSTLKDSTFDEGNHTIEHKNVDSVTPVVTITDITTKPEDINIVLQGRNSSKTIAVDSSNSSVDGYTRKITLPTISSEDVYDLKISVGDRIIRESIASRNSSVTNIGFGIDRTKPSLSVTAGGKSITEGSTTYLNAKDTMDLVAKVNDNILSDNEIKTVITSNGNSKNSTTHTFSSDNTYNVNVTATDNALNSNSLNFTIIVDTVIPKVTIEGVTEGKFFNKDITPIITTDDETAVETITLNNTTYTKGTIINKDNDYSLVAKAEDEAGNIGEASVNFVLDKTKPIINIKNIEADAFYDKGTLIPDIEVIDNDKEVETVIFLDNKEYTGGPISTDGSHVLSVKAVDRASNTSQATVKFKTNFNPPSITVHGIKDNEIFTGPVKLNIEFEDTKLYYILINGKEYMNGDIIYKPGKYKMEIIAIDEFDSESRQIINFTINEGVVAPSSIESNGPTANTYKLIAVSIIAILTLVLFVVFSKIFKPKNS